MGYEERMEASGDYVREKGWEMFCDGDFDDEIYDRIIKGDFDDAVKEREKKIHTQ